MANLARYITPTLILPILTAAAILFFFAYYWSAVAPRAGGLAWIAERSRGRPRFSFADMRHPMGRRDALPLLLLTAVYAVTAFWNLGSFQDPQSFARLRSGESAVIELKQTVSLGSFLYYPGLNTGAYTLEVSADGESWQSLWAKTGDDGKVEFYYWADGAGYAPSKALTQKYSELFKWIEIVPSAPVEAKYIRLTARPDAGKDWLELGELCLVTDQGGRISAREVLSADGAAAALVDEFDTVPQRSTWYNSTYFDEIYHARTAYEHIQGVYPYEVTHPPLGKLILGLGIRVFGMTPFGWRFMGTLFGVGMLPLLYVFLKNLFGKTAVAACGAALFAFDFMHLTQTRIATIDTYGVFFILAMYFFLYRWLTTPTAQARPGAPDSDLRAEEVNPSALRRIRAVPASRAPKGYGYLFLSGLMWGLGAASKWTVIYGAAGLAVLYFLGLWFKCRDWPAGGGAPRPGPWVVKTLLFSVLCFVVIPAVIYTLSYLPYAQAKGDVSLQGLVGTMWENQKYMLHYHEGVHDPHPYSSRWYQWIVDARPILYYLDGTSGAAQGLKAAFGAFSNPVVCWAGLFALLSTAVQAVRRRCAKALFIVVGYLAQLLPWTLIFRTTFEYHYFPSTLFLVLALCYVFNDLAEANAKGWRTAVYGLTGGAVALYFAFYPVLVGMMAPTWYTTNFLKWLPSWPF